MQKPPVVPTVTTTPIKITNEETPATASTSTTIKTTSALPSTAPTSKPTSTATQSNNVEQEIVPSSQNEFKEKPINVDDKVVLLNEDFSSDLKSNRNWKHVVGVSREGFQYYSNQLENRF